MKKKSHKKPRSAKRSPPHRATNHSGHAKATKRTKRAKRRGERPRPEAHSSPLFRAIKRRREAERGEHREPHEKRAVSHHAHKHGASPARKQDHAEPVITEKSFEKMLAMRRFQHHTR